jgi:hypothetical protein
MNMGAIAARTLLLAALAALVLAGPAGATTSGGFQATSDGPMVLAGGRALVVELNLGSPSRDDSTVLNARLHGFGAPDRAWSTNQLYGFTFANPAAPAPVANPGPPVLVGGAGGVALAWIDLDGVHSAAVDPQAATLGAVVTQSTTGPLSGGEALALALGEGGTRGLAWVDGGGVHVQGVSPAGALAPAALVTTATSDHLTLNADGAGGWWVLWRAAGRFRAADVSGAGALGSTADLGPASLTRAANAPAGLSPWRAVNDGAGGLWVGVAGHLRRLDRFGGVQNYTLRRGLALEGSGRLATVATGAGRDDIVLRRLADARRRPVRLRHAGRIARLAVDPATGATDVLAHDARGRTVLARVGASSPTAIIATVGVLVPCRGRPPVQILADAGLIAVSCFGPYVDEPQADFGGGGGYSSRELTYLLVRGARVLRYLHRYEVRSEF